MKKLVISAVAASVASATALASESEWARLDRDVQALSASLTADEASPVKLSGYIRLAYIHSGDLTVGTPPDDKDVGDFEVLQARLKASGTRGNVEYVLQAGLESAGSESLLKDAYVNIGIGETLKVRAGQFKNLIARDSLVSSSRLFFADRSEIGTLFSSRAEGVALLGYFEAFEWMLSVQDGTDDAGDDYVISLRGVLHLLGNGVDNVEGAYGAPEGVEGTVGAAYWDDGNLDEGDGFLVEATLASNMFSLNAWVADMGDDLYTGNESSSIFGSYLPSGSGSLISPDSTPFGVMATFMVTQATPDQGGWEVGVRFQDMDDMADTNVMDAGVNYYASGHNYKYFLQYKKVDSDDGDADAIIFGLNVGY